MLAQSFLSAEDLQITEPERDALIAVLHRFETDPPKHVQYDESNFSVGWDYGVSPDFFNLTHIIGELHNCGTVGCIMGFALAIDKNLFLEKKDPVRQLFGLGSLGPEAILFDYQKITTEHAAFALRNFLTRGAAHWEEIL